MSLSFEPLFRFHKAHREIYHPADNLPFARIRKTPHTAFRVRELPDLQCAPAIDDAPAADNAGEIAEVRYLKYAHLSRVIVPLTIGEQALRR